MVKDIEIPHPSIQSSYAPALLWKILKHVTWNLISPKSFSYIFTQFSLTLHLTPTQSFWYIHLSYINFVLRWALSWTMNSFAMCTTLTYSLAEYSLEVQLKTFKHSIVDMAVLGLWQFSATWNIYFLYWKFKFFFFFFEKNF